MTDDREEVTTDLAVCTTRTEAGSDGAYRDSDDNDDDLAPAGQISSVVDMEPPDEPDDEVDDRRIAEFCCVADAYAMGCSLLPGRYEIPHELRRSPQWIVWERVHRDGRVTKVPRHPRDPAQAASVMDASVPVHLDDALLTLGRYQHQLDGVGIVLRGDGIVGIDLDYARDAVTQEATDWAQAILGQFVLAGAYIEISPSGTGYRIIVRGHLPPHGGNRVDVGDGGVIECYSDSRYLTITSDVVSGGGADRLADAQLAIDWLYGTHFPTASARSAVAGSTRAPSWSDSSPSEPVGHPGNDDQLIEAALAAANGEKLQSLLHGDTSEYSGDDSAADMALASLLAFWAGPDQERIIRLMRRSALQRFKWDRADYLPRTVERVLAGRTDYYRPPEPGPRIVDAERPTVVITADEFRVTEEVLNTLRRSEPDLYHRGGMLVRVIMDDSTVHVSHTEAAPKISSVPPAVVREMISRRCRLVAPKVIGSGEDQQVLERPAHPPVWLVDAIAKRGDYPGFRALRGVATTPILRPDGSLVTVPGYDPATRVIYQPVGPQPTVLEHPTREDGIAAKDRLYDLVSDFPFVDEKYKAAWLGLLLTLVSRETFNGPAPAFLIDANTRGAGKGLLTAITGVIATGAPIAVSSLPESDAEMRKRITSIAMAGTPVVLFDNVAGSFGTASLDAALTSTVWQDRLLGSNTTVELPLAVTWVATGNNVPVAADAARRVCHIRLESPEERPEERTGFRHADLLGYVRQNRAAYLGDALLILRAWYDAGQPTQHLPSWGSYEAWSGVIRQVIVWLGLPDPHATRSELLDSADVDAGALSMLIASWGELTRGRATIPGQVTSVTAAEIVRLLDEDRPHAYVPDPYPGIRDAVSSLIGGRRLTANSLGCRLRHFRGRVVDGKMLTALPNRKGIQLWTVVEAEAA